MENGDKITISTLNPEDAGERQSWHQGEQLCPKDGQEVQHTGLGAEVPTRHQRD